MSSNLFIANSLGITPGTLIYQANNTNEYFYELYPSQSKEFPVLAYEWSGSFEKNKGQGNPRTITEAYEAIKYFFGESHNVPNTWDEDQRESSIEIEDDGSSPEPIETIAFSDEKFPSRFPLERLTDNGIRSLIPVARTWEGELNLFGIKELKDNLRALAWNILLPLSKKFDFDIISCYRPPNVHLTEDIKNSDHLYGLAVDIKLKKPELTSLAALYVKNNLPWNKLILFKWNEGGITNNASYLHISHYNGKNHGWEKGEGANPTGNGTIRRIGGNGVPIQGFDDEISSESDYTIPVSPYVPKLINDSITSNTSEIQKALDYAYYQKYNQVSIKSGNYRLSHHIILREGNILSGDNTRLLSILDNGIIANANNITIRNIHTDFGILLEGDNIIIDNVIAPIIKIIGSNNRITNSSINVLEIIGDENRIENNRFNRSSSYSIKINNSSLFRVVDNFFSDFNKDNTGTGIIEVTNGSAGIIRDNMSKLGSGNAIAKFANLVTSTSITVSGNVWDTGITSEV